MITTRIALDAWEKSFDPDEITAWCISNIGPRAEFSDQVDNYRPWGMQYEFAMHIYYFANEEDATLFRLRWV